VIGTRTVLAALAVAAAAPAHAAVVISTAATQNMSCSGGVCAPTATEAVLNVTDLENDLSQFGNVTVMTTGNGVEANNIVVRAAFSSPDSTSLTLDAHKAITINAAVSIGSGTAELELQDDGALSALSFGSKGNITFGSLSDIFGINGGIFTLVGSVQGLASAIAANAAGAYALANNYDASADGTYVDPPVTTTFTGLLDGLGNVISKLKIQDDEDVPFRYAALFEELGSGGVIRNIGLADVSVRVIAPSLAYPAALVGQNEGTIVNAFATGSVRGREGPTAGGLVAVAGTSSVISNSYAAVAVTCTGSGGTCGGLVGFETGTIETSFATGPVVLCGGECVMGGFVGATDGATISDSYATGEVNPEVSANYSYIIGGFIGFQYMPSNHVVRSYSTGAVSAAIGRRQYAGGFIGGRADGNTDLHAYWDTTTSGTAVGVGGGSSKGIEGLTTEQFQSGLPAGFDPKIWAENPNINNGFPYLIHNPPPK
jgi:hypothetical protein